MEFLSVLRLLCSVLITLIGVLYAYRILFVIVGLFFTKQYPKAGSYHKYAVVIAARNEESVIGNLLDSIRKQDYPSDLITVFVAADNCEDSTAATARAHGAVCYERFDKKHCTKGYALRWLFQRIEKDYGIDSFDGYFIFDADNLLKRDFLLKMNDAFDAGEKIVTSYRNTKNLDEGCLASGYALHWMRTARMESRGRSYLNVSTRLQGTGYLVSADLLTKGWQYISLTEDREFSANAVAEGIRIAYQHDAVFYDEQPTSFPIVWRQRLRWSKGNLYVFTHYFAFLLRGTARHSLLADKFSCIDMNLTNLPYAMFMLPLKLTAALLSVITAPVTEASDWCVLVMEILNICLFEHLGVIPLGLLLFITERDRIIRLPLYKKLWYILTFPLFGIIGDVSLFAAAFTKVTWKPIPHEAKIKIEEIEKRTP